jgi:hypothetical protein
LIVSGRTDDPLDRASKLFFSAIVADAKGERVRLDILRAEFLSIADQIGPEFGPQLVARAAGKLAERLSRASYAEAESAVYHDLKRLFPHRRFYDLGEIVPWGRA